MAANPLLKSLAELIGYELTSTSYWRTLKADEFPEDKRNIQASMMLDALARQIPSLEGTQMHQGLANSVRNDSDGVFSLALSETARMVGFSRFPADLPQFIREIYENWAWISGRGGADLIAAATPTLLMQTVVDLAAQTSDGVIIRAVTEPWFEVIKWLEADPRRAFEIDDRRWEELIAGAYKRAGFDNVILTPRAGDLGRDVIAEIRGLGTVRVIDQVKAFGPDHRVTANDVRALLGVLTADGASKGFLTTTSTFAPRLRTDRLLAPFMPSRLELVDGKMLMTRLSALAKTRSQ